MTVCITEKPSVARDIAHVIGANAKREGYFEGNGYQVTWAYGHLCCLKEPEDYQAEWRKWDGENRISAAASKSGLGLSHHGTMVGSSLADLYDHSDLLETYSVPTYHAATSPTFVFPIVAYKSVYSMGCSITKSHYVSCLL